MGRHIYRVLNEYNIVLFIILSGAEMQCGGQRTGEETGERGVAMVERTRRGVEAMEVASDGISSKASSDKISERISLAAREGWNKIRAKLKGKWLRREGDGLVVEERVSGLGESAKGTDDLVEEMLDEGEGGTVEVEEDVMDKEDSVSRASGESRKTRYGLDFLEDLKVDDVDEELEKTRQIDRKRKRTEEKMEVKIGMDGIQGWEWREREGREEKRWKREVTEEKRTGSDEVTREVKTEKILLPDNYRLGGGCMGDEIESQWETQEQLWVRQGTPFSGREEWEAGV
jgi:hypothetical protein